MEFSMDMFFRQYWVDKRLSFEGLNELVVSAEFLNQIWVPDTFIGNCLALFWKRLQIFTDLVELNSRKSMT